MNLLSFSDGESKFFVGQAVEGLKKVRGGREAAERIGAVLARYTVFDLQYIGGGIQREVRKLPGPYRRCYEPYSADLMSQYHAVMTRFRAGGFADVPIQEPELWCQYWDVTAVQCFVRGRSGNDPFPQVDHPMSRLFYRLVYGYVMLIAGGYGHPVGMPFPGGARVRREGDRVFCPIREKERDLPSALCNFCPAEQDPEYV